MSDLTAPLERFRRRLRVPAVVGALTDADGGLVVEAVGRRSRAEAAAPVTAGDTWHIGSCGKAITAVLYALLVEAGLTTWDRPVGSLFPDVTDVDPGWDTPTIDDLLHCRAGVTPNPPRSQLGRLWDCELPPAEQRTRAVQSVLADAPREPGRFRYSNLSYVAVGAAIDRIAGIPFEQELRDRVTEPLGIESLGFGPPPEVCGHGSRLRVGPLVLGRGAPADPADARSDNPTLLTPAGRMHLSMADWAAFLRVFLNDGRPLLTAETIRRLTDMPEGKRSMAMGWASAAGAGAWIGMQGSNTAWAATALIDDDRTRAAMVVANDGRTKVLQRSALLAKELLGLGDRAGGGGPPRA